MLNLAKLKAANVGSNDAFFSLSMKNLFGLIPEPNRSNYHGKGDTGLANSIADMCKIYTAMFRATHVAEAVYNTLISREGLADPENPRRGLGLISDLGLAVTSPGPVDLDAFVVSLFGCDPAQRYFWKAARGILGNWDIAHFPEVPARYEALFAPYR